MEKKKQTAVEWLEELASKGYISPENFERAKQLEKEQIVEAYIEGYCADGFTVDSEKYYNETYGE